MQPIENQFRLQPTTKKWIHNALRTKKASFHLLSTKSTHLTRQECARLLEHLDVSVTISTHELVCTLKLADGEHNSISNLADSRIDNHNYVRGGILQFRVRVMKTTRVEAATGYPTAIDMILEKGEKKVFQAICDGLRHEWHYDVLPTQASDLQLS